MPFCRRRRPHTSSIQISQMEVEGTTMLCFPTDHSWFQGNINTNDDSSYSLIGERLDPQQNGSEDEQISHNNPDNNNNDNKGEGHKGEEEGLSPVLYKVTLTDHFTGLSYHLPEIRVDLDPKSSSLLSCSQDAQVDFKVEQVYRSQKADMMIQRHIGSPSLVGQNCLVYTGPISLLFNDTISTGRNWCL